MAGRDHVRLISDYLAIHWAWTDEKIESWFDKPCLILGEPVTGGRLETNREVVDSGRGEELLQLIYECLGNGNY